MLATMLGDKYLNYNTHYRFNSFYVMFCKREPVAFKSLVQIKFQL